MAAVHDSAHNTPLNIAAFTPSKILVGVAYQWVSSHNPLVDTLLTRSGTWKGLQTPKAYTVFTRPLAFVRESHLTSCAQFNQSYTTGSGFL